MDVEYLLATWFTVMGGDAFTNYGNNVLQTISSAFKVRTMFPDTLINQRKNSKKNYELHPITLVPSLHLVLPIKMYSHELP